jgi:polar amino acid transport system permease protein
MKQRSLALCVPLAALLLVALVAAPAVAAAASPSPVPSPLSTGRSAGLPVVKQGVPNATSETATEWGGNSVQIYFIPGASPVVPGESELYINGTRIDTGPPVMSSLIGGTQLQFNLPSSLNLPAGETTFKAVLHTEKGQTVPYEWKFQVTGKKKPGLVNFQIMREWWWYITKGAYYTILLTVVSIVFASIFALFGALGRLSKTMTFRQAWEKHHSWGYMVGHTLRMIPYWLATFYTSLFRGTPLLLQIYVIYYALPAVILYGRARWGIFTHIPYPTNVQSGIAALSLNYGAYLTEVFRAGIQAVPKGQREAAWALGLNGRKTYQRIILPQAFKIVIPAIGNDFIALIKDTSLVSAIAVPELIKQAQIVGGKYYDFLSPLLVAAVVYWLLTIFFSFWQARLERRMERDRARKG